LFSGYEGIAAGLRDVFPDLELAFVSDIDDGACKILAHRHPDVPNLGDVSKVDWTPWGGGANGNLPRIKILTGGFP
jgi:DNA (cytosine-5)-methyltransferase 1